MTREERSEVGRRGFLAVVGTATATATLAGCLEGDGEDELPDDDAGVADEDEPEEDDEDEVGDADEEEPDDDEDEDDEEEVDDGDPDEREGDSIAITQTQDPTTLDPHDHRETTTDNVLLQAYEFILARDEEGEIIEGIATEWDVEEPDEHRLTIREDVQFHSGNELTAEDCAFSINRVVDPDAGNLESPQADQLAGVTGAEADGDEVVVSSEGENPMAFANLASYCPMVEEEWVMDREPEEVAEEINGTGPYQLEEFVDGEYTEFTSFEDYWDGEPEIEGVTIDASSEASTRINSLLAGEVDIVTAVPPDDAARVDGEEDTHIADAPSTRILMLPMRYDVEPFSSQEFRQALNYAIDFEAIIDEVLAGFGDATAQPTLEGYFGHNDELEPYPYDPEQAEELIEESGHADEEITLEVPAGRYLQSDEIAQACVGYLDDLDNLSCEIEMRDFGEMTGVLLDGDIESSPPFFLIGWGNTTFDAQQNLLPWLTGDTSQYTFLDDELEDLILSASNEVDEDEREQLLEDANERAHELAVFVFLNREYLIYGINDRIDWEPRQDEFSLVHEMSLN